MAIRVTSRARGHADRAGDPLDGLVNLFDLGIVLAVAFLLGGLTALRSGGEDPLRKLVVVRRDAHVRRAALQGKRALGAGRRIGAVYELADGRVVVVRDGRDRRAARRGADAAPITP